ncbi:MAG: hypothetical protein BWK79_16960 [Beggiatoa sp. IS2]|nr:MAG: hypothetical protein BWK79_16960 [Beggiatoa sp. IS2]
MKRNICVILLLITTTLFVACSESEQQKAAQDMSHQQELEKAKQVQNIVNDKVAKESQEVKKETGENTEPAEDKKPE